MTSKKQSVEQYRGVHIARTMDGLVRATWRDSLAYSVHRSVADAKRYITEVETKKERGEW